MRMRTAARAFSEHTESATTCVQWSVRSPWTSKPSAPAQPVA